MATLLFLLWRDGEASLPLLATDGVTGAADAPPPPPLADDAQRRLIAVRLRGCHAFAPPATLSCVLAAHAAGGGGDDCADAGPDDGNGGAVAAVRSYVLGDDIVPRLSLASAHGLRDALLFLDADASAADMARAAPRDAARCVLPAIRREVMARAFVIHVPSVGAAMASAAARRGGGSAGDDPLPSDGDATPTPAAAGGSALPRSLSPQPPSTAVLLLPAGGGGAGRGGSGGVAACYLDREPPMTSRRCRFGGARAVAPDELCEILISSDMFAAHMPGAYVIALERVAAATAAADAAASAAVAAVAPPPPPPATVAEEASAVPPIRPPPSETTTMAIDDDQLAEWHDARAA